MNLSMEESAVAVMGPEVSGERTTSRKGWSRARASRFATSAAARQLSPSLNKGRKSVPSVSRNSILSAMNPLIRPAFVPALPFPSSPPLLPAPLESPFALAEG